MEVVEVVEVVGSPPPPMVESDPIQLVIIILLGCVSLALCVVVLLMGCWLKRQLKERDNARVKRQRRRYDSNRSTDYENDENERRHRRRHDRESSSREHVAEVTLPRTACASAPRPLCRR